MIEALLVIIIILLAVILYQMRRQHQELIKWIDAFAEMVGEAIDSIRKRK